MLVLADAAARRRTSRYPEIELYSPSIQLSGNRTEAFNSILAKNMADSGQTDSGCIFAGLIAC